MRAIKSIATAVPENAYSAEQVLSETKNWWRKEPEAKILFERLVSSVQVDRRHFVLPISEILKLTTVAERSEIFWSAGKALGVASAKDALLSAKLESSAVRSLIFTSCSLPTIPALDVEMISALGISPAVRRVPIYQHGCAGGVVALTLASALTSQNMPTLITSVELCSLVFQGSDNNGGNLVGSALFADGAASVIVDEEGDLEILASRSYLIPGTSQVMGYDILEDGSHLRLQRELPSLLADHIPALVKEFLAERGLIPSDLDFWLFHPGGTKILSLLEESFELPRAKTHWAWDVLRGYGNMSSASILFVLNEFLRERPWRAGEHALVVGVGPGLTIELVLLRGLPR